MPAELLPLLELCKLLGAEAFDLVTLAKADCPPRLRSRRAKALVLCRRWYVMRFQLRLRNCPLTFIFPHLEGCWPYSRTHLRMAFAGVPEDEVRLMVGRNAADVYAFDWPLLERLADRHGPTPEEVDDPLPAEDIPDEALRCPAFAAARFGR